jgi:hypothetical protein
MEDAAGIRARRARLGAAVGAVAAVVAAGLATWVIAGSVTISAGTPGVVAFLASAVQLAGRWLLDRRRRRGRWSWRPALVLPGGVRPGLVARWSVAAFAVDAVGAVAFSAAGLLEAGRSTNAGSRWNILWLAAAGVVLLVFAVRLFARLRWSGCLAVTESGVAAGGKLLPWAQIHAIECGDNGIVIHMRSGKPIPVDGAESVVPDQQLAEILRFHLDHPGRRTALITGPEHLAVPSR